MNEDCHFMHFHLDLYSQLCGALDHKFTSNQKSEIRDDGSVYVSFETTQLPEIRRWVLGQGSTVKVLAPQELIEDVKNELKKTMKIYEG